MDDYADLINPPLTYEAYDKDIPAEKIYGKSVANPDQVRTKDVADLVKTWLAEFNEAMDSIAADPSQVSLLSNLIADHGMWKDHLALTWDMHTFDTIEVIKTNVAKYQPQFKLANFEVDVRADYRLPTGCGLVTVHEKSESSPIPIEWVQVYLTFTSDFGSGKALIRLISVSDEGAQGGLKAYTIYTLLEELYGNEEILRGRRPEGVNHGQHKDRQSWVERRAAEQTYDKDHQPVVLIVGGGQGGLTTAARLKVMGVEALIIEKNERIGDNWRNRYKFLVLHDPVWYDHLPYIPFPETWPIYTPKDKVGDWFDSYAKSMELNFWTSKTVVGAVFDDKTEVWTVTIKDNKTNEQTTLQPKHLVMSTGHSGEPRIPTFKNQEKFKGKVVHSSRHTTGKEFTGKNALVVGCCNSAHDIAQDFYEQGATVTMLQRSSTCVISSEIGLKINTRGVYEENGPKVETADIIAQSIPTKLNNLLQQQQFRETVHEEKPMIDALKAKGFKFDSGYGGTGLFGKYYRRGGGYYIDVGCSKLIANGSIQFKQGVEIEEFTENGVIFTDGTKLEDVSIIVLATGYSNMRDTARRIFGEEMAKELKEVWGLDEEGEFKTMWRDSGHKNFWYMGGNLALSRFYSKRLALRIIAHERGFI